MESREIIAESRRLFYTWCIWRMWQGRLPQLNSLTYRKGKAMRKLSSFLVFLLTMGIPFVCPGTEPQEKPGAEMTTKEVLQQFRDQKKKEFEQFRRQMIKNRKKELQEFKDKFKKAQAEDRENLKKQFEQEQATRLEETKRELEQKKNELKAQLKQLMEQRDKELQERMKRRFNQKQSLSNTPLRAENLMEELVKPYL